MPLRVADRMNHPWAGKKVWVPWMSHGGTRALAACFRAMGIEAECLPRPDTRGGELGTRYTGGDECYPMMVTLGDFLRLLEQPGVDPNKVVLFMPGGAGPCRFGQYVPHIERVLASRGYGGVTLLSPTFEQGYSEVGDKGSDFVRSAWRALVSGDILLKLLLKTRPYEVVPGSADAAHDASLGDLCNALEVPYRSAGEQLEAVKASLLRSRDRFRRVPARYDPERPLIGVVGEIFCRLNAFSNDEVVRRMEGLGGEAWMADVAEWIWYTNNEQFRSFRREGRHFSATALGAKIRAHFQKKDEHELVSLFREDFRGYEEPEDIAEILRYAEPYLPARGAEGEMVVNIGKTIYLAKKGVDGIIDISPFTCMNGIVCEAVYPRVSRDHADIPIRNFYFDGTQSDVERDLGIYLELARSYRRRKPWSRVYPACFPADAAVAP